MRTRKPLSLAGCALLLHGLLPAFATPARADEDGIAAVVYWRLPFGGAAAHADEASFGFRLDQFHDRRFMQPSHGTSTDIFLPPPALDFRFDEGGMRSLSFAGVDTLPVFVGRLNQNGEGGQEQLNILEWFALVLAAAAAGVAVCEFGFECFSGDDDNDGSTGGDPGTGDLAFD